MRARRATLGVVLALGLMLALPGCVADQLRQIEASTLSAQQKAEASLHAVEQSWVSAKVALADVLTDLTLLGLEVDTDTKRRLRQVLYGGNVALKLARAALESGEISPAGQLAGALRQLQAAIRSIAGHTTTLEAMTPGGTP